jgi:transposase
MDDRLATRRTELVALTQRDGDPRVRHRAHALLDLADSPSPRATAQRMDVSVKSLGRWRSRFLAEGGAGLRDRIRPGRPLKLPAAAQTVLETALAEDPMTYGYPMATWTIADLTDLLARRGWTVSAATVNRLMHALGYVHRRPRHDLRHRQDAEAVASARHVLATLQKRGLISAAESACSISTSASCTPIPIWRRSGSAAERPAAFPPPEPTGA